MNIRFFLRGLIWEKITTQKLRWINRIPGAIILLFGVIALLT